MEGVTARAWPGLASGPHGVSSLREHGAHQRGWTGSPLLVYPGACHGPRSLGREGCRRGSRMSATYTAICKRVGRWWEITVPDLDSGCVTQARRLRDVEATVIDLATLMAEVPE